MSICAFEYRYGSKEMRNIFKRTNMVKRLIDVEVALIGALADANLIPQVCEEEIRNCIYNVKLEEIDKLEKIVGHDIVALVTLLAEKCGECGKYIHLGATSYDIIDTAWALIIRDALELVKRKFKAIIWKLIELVKRYRDTIMVGRTHGQHALPITLGFKLANYVYELTRSYERILECEKRIIKAKIGGAVGTMAAWDKHGFIIENGICRRLDLEPHIISTQVAPRDGFAELISVFAILASQLDRLAIEIRELSRPEIAELAEGIERIGSSTMPHKKNPVLSERISSIAKILRGFVITALENIPLWHERDLSNSAAERILIPHAFLAIDQALEDMLKVLKNLEAYPQNMRRNLDISKGAIMAEAIMVKLVEKGVPRHEAHQYLVKLARKVYEENKKFKDILIEDPFITKHLTISEIEECLKYENYLGQTQQLIERVLTYAKKIIK